MPYGGDLRAVFDYFLDDDREDFAETITKEGIKSGLSVAAFWNLPVHHMFFQFLKRPEPGNDFDRLTSVREQNATASKPFILWDILPECRG